MLVGEVLLTGGSGTMGRAIIKRATNEKWDCRITIYSGDVLKHHKIKQDYPEIRSIVGDVRDYGSLANAMTGKDYVLHLAAKKHIPESEFNCVDTFEVNVIGSMNVCQAAMQLNTPNVLGISTDKAAHPANCYGATKMLMEKIFGEYSRLGLKTQYHLVRYGNVLESNGSVIEAWRRSIAAGEMIKMTDPNMTRFWLSPSQGVDCIIRALKQPSGCIYIPLLPALSLGKLADYTVEFNGSNTITKRPIEKIPLRPGEKMHETLLTYEEGWYAQRGLDHFLLAPSTSYRLSEAVPPYTSENARELTQPELLELLANG